SGKIKRLCGEKMSMTRPEETFALTGFWPGGVCPFGVDGMKIYVDDSLRAWETIYPAAGNDATGVPLSYEKLLRICGGLICDVTAEESFSI
ncbi:MAG: YbaK/EbsC family protein, partial [Spirochaetia bacterium]|nr:YbaK/EbsC family protein [Spirochaetia bacterium]